MSPSCWFPNQLHDVYYCSKQSYIYISPWEPWSFRTCEESKARKQTRESTGLKSWGSWRISTLIVMNYYLSMFYTYIISYLYKYTHIHIYIYVYICIYQIVSVSIYIYKISYHIYKLYIICNIILYIYIFAAFSFSYPLPTTAILVFFFSPPLELVGSSYLGWFFGCKYPLFKQKTKWLDVTWLENHHVCVVW